MSYYSIIWLVDFYNSIHQCARKFIDFYYILREKDNFVYNIHSEESYTYELEVRERVIELYV